MNRGKTPYVDSGYQQGNQGMREWCRLWDGFSSKYGCVNNILGPPSPMGVIIFIGGDLERPHGSCRSLRFHQRDGFGKMG